MNLNKFIGKGDPLSSANIDFSQMKSVLTSAGESLAEIHSIKLRGFGPPKSKNEFVGKYETWYEFITTFFDDYSRKIDTGDFSTELSKANRSLFDKLMSKRDITRQLLEKNKNLINTAEPRLLNGNLHIGSILVKDKKFAGFGDFSQILIGDPVDDLAYFSVMPRGEKLLPYLLKGWEKTQKRKLSKEKMQLYRLLEAYRKVFSRFIKHGYLEIYPEPLFIAQKQLQYYNMW